jgi:hypothetical protein
MPPLQISRSVATHVSHAKRLRQRVDLPEFPQFILEKIIANSADFADGFLVAVGLCDAAQVLFLGRFAQRSGYS